MTETQQQLSHKIWVAYRNAVLENNTENQKRCRIALSKVSIENFVKLYLKHDFTLTPDELRTLRATPYFDESVLDKYSQRVVFNKVNRKIFDIGTRAHQQSIKYGCAFPRGFTKSTSVRAVILHALALKKQQFILYIGDEHKKTEIHIMNTRNELLFNRELLNDFPHLKPRQQPTKKIDIAFNAGLMLLQEGILCMSSSGSSQRGMNILGQRPTLIICDDLENRKNMNTLDLRNKLKDWFKTEVMSLGGVADCSIFMIGTIVHFDSMLKEIIDGKWVGWEYDSMPAIDNNLNEPLWELYPKERLLEKKDELGSTAFSSEYMNIPFSDETAIFKEHYVKKNLFDPDFMTNLEPERLVCFIDNNHATKGDYCAIILVYKDIDDTYYVLDADIDNTRGEIAKEEFIVQFQRKWGFRILGIEKNNQDGFIARIKNRFLTFEGIPIYVKGIHHTQNKEIRIVSYLQPLIEAGRMKFRHDYAAAYPKLIQQLLEFPSSKNDDAPDSLAGTIETISKLLMDKKENWENIHRHNIEALLDADNGNGNGSLQESIELKKNAILDRLQKNIEKNKKDDYIKNNNDSEGNMNFQKVFDLINENKVEWYDHLDPNDKHGTVRKRAQIDGGTLQYLIKNGAIKITFCDAGSNVWQVKNCAPYEHEKIRESIWRFEKKNCNGDNDRVISIQQVDEDSDQAALKKEVEELKQALFDKKAANLKAEQEATAVAIADVPEPKTPKPAPKKKPVPRKPAGRPRKTATSARKK
jgi:predicted phage terminase large subunit-like protein